MLTDPAPRQTPVIADKETMVIEVRPVYPEFVAEILGIELSGPVDRSVVDKIWEAIDRHAVLMFHDQHLDDEGLRDLASNFGELEIGRAAGAAASGIAP